MEVIKNTIFIGADNRKSVLDLFLVAQNKPQPIIVFCHGYKGFKDWGAWNLMAEYFVNQGFNFLKFNFSHNGGTVKNPIDFPDLNAFGLNRYSYEMEDLDHILNWLTESKEYSNQINTDEIYLVGHSRGGGISILKSAQDSRIKKLITLAAVSDFKSRSIFGGDHEEWKKNKARFVLNGRTKQEMPHYYSFYEDFMENEKYLSIEIATKKIKIPFLIIHGDDDQSIFIREAENLKEWCPKAQFEIIPNASHTFNTRHPQSEPLPIEFARCLEKMVLFLNEKSND